MKMSLANKMAWLCVMSIVLLLGGAFALYCSVFQPKTDVEAFTTSSDSSTYIKVGELLNDTSLTAMSSSARTFNETNLTTLVNMIYGASGSLSTQISSLKSSTASTPLTAGTRARLDSNLCLQRHLG